MDPSKESIRKISARRVGDNEVPSQVLDEIRVPLEVRNVIHLRLEEVASGGVRTGEEEHRRDDSTRLADDEHSRWRDAPLASRLDVAADLEKGGAQRIKMRGKHLGW